MSRHHRNKRHRKHPEAPMAAPSCPIKPTGSLPPLLSDKTKVRLRPILIVAIGCALGVEGAHYADWLFLGLAVIVEIA